MIYNLVFLLTFLVAVVVFEKKEKQVVECKQQLDYISENMDKALMPDSDEQVILPDVDPATPPIKPCDLDPTRADCVLDMMEL